MILFQPVLIEQVTLWLLCVSIIWEENIPFANQLFIGYKTHMHILWYDFTLENIKLNFFHVLSKCEIKVIYHAY